MIFFLFLPLLQVQIATLWSEVLLRANAEPHLKSC